MNEVRKGGNNRTEYIGLINKYRNNRLKNDARKEGKQDTARNRTRKNEELWKELEMNGNRMIITAN